MKTNQFNQKQEFTSAILFLHDGLESVLEATSWTFHKKLMFLADYEVGSLKYHIAIILNIVQEGTFVASLEAAGVWCLTQNILLALKKADSTCCRDQYSSHVTTGIIQATVE